MPNPSADQSATHPPESPPPGIVRQVLANKGFIACVILLLAFTVSFEVLASLKNIQFKKEPVPLKKQLSLMDQSLLRQPLFSVSSSLRGHLYDGLASPAVVEAFQQNGIKLSSESRVEVKEFGKRWQVTDQIPGNRSERSYLIENNAAAGRLDVCSPYRLLQAVEIKPEILDGLGTDQYIQWTLLDESGGGEIRPENYIQLFVTYYTGAPDQVPHVPEECYMGGGGYQVKTEALVDVPVPELGADQFVQVKMLELQRPSFLTNGAKIVMYVFNTNGRFCSDRNCVRNAMADPFERRAYFSKLEVTFGTHDVLPTKEAAIEAGKRFLSVVIPVLVKDHWPDWDQNKQTDRQTRSTGATDGK